MSKKLAEYWDWTTGAAIPDARIAVCAPGIGWCLDDRNEGPVVAHIERGGLVVASGGVFGGTAPPGIIPALHVTRQADLARLPDLLAVKAEKRALVVSPEEAIDLGVDMASTKPLGVLGCDRCSGFGVILRSGTPMITGAEHEGPCPLCDGWGRTVDAVFIVGLDKPMHVDWVRSIVEQCRKAGVPCVFLGWGDWIPQSQAAGVDTLARNATATLGGDTEVWFRVGARSGAMLDGQLVEDVPAWLEPRNARPS